MRAQHQHTHASSAIGIQDVAENPLELELCCTTTNQQGHPRRWVAFCCGVCVCNPLMVRVSWTILSTFLGRERQIPGKIGHPGNLVLGKYLDPLGKYCDSNKKGLLFPLTSFDARLHRWLDVASVHQDLSLSPRAHVLCSSACYRWCEQAASHALSLHSRLLLST